MGNSKCAQIREIEQNQRNLNLTITHIREKYSSMKLSERSRGNLER
jgi:hypothetical protein